ncbi:hypothetical protein GW626_04100 [Peribacillus muralis]|uniref:hypothetical protein n=1 Tax=Peribacillus muralis TaxID=264697 RepID=UPI001F4E873B|nr:hypothetical protein [Peribacillus muralis]MCK1993192.1 hypothetical protein [Peribacillus muralis]MCK2013746.1 hypothetical protein [Peribacillus muralis]
MPIIKLYSPNSCPDTNILSDICNRVTDSLNIPVGHAWAFWHQQESFHKPDWGLNGTNAPMIMIYCKNSYNNEQIQGIIEIISNVITQACSCDKESIYISCFRIEPGHLMVRGELWEGN